MDIHIQVNLLATEPTYGDIYENELDMGRTEIYGIYGQDATSKATTKV